MSHHTASFQVFPEGKGTRGMWIADLLPSEAAPRIATMIEQGLAAMKNAFEGNGAAEFVAASIALGSWRVPS